MSNFKTTFTLKQHTPIIHFQANQAGATLRATELKPKFDRFLIEKNPNISVKINANGHKSLDYKVKIEQNISPKEEIPDRHPLFFANMKPKDISDIEWQKVKKRFKTYNRTFKIEFFSFNKDILKAIKNDFKAFLAHTNFGTRQSKGFGSFYIAGESFDTGLINQRVYSFASSNWQKDIGLFYQFLRQGINLTKRTSSPFYTKPAIFTYAKYKGWQWDKKSIKEAYFSDALESQINEHQSDVVKYTSDKKYLLRDLFGLSSSQEWKSYGKTIEKEDTKKDKDGKPEIERFKSPITFKVVDDVVYFWVNDTIDDMLNQTFKIKAGRQNDLQLSTPPRFDFDEFFEFVLKIDLSTHIEEKFHNTNEYKNLNRILNAIKVSR